MSERFNPNLDRAGVITLMKSSTSSKEWGHNCDVVKAAYNGNYPEFWYEEILASGLADETLAKFGASTKLNIIALD